MGRSLLNAPLPVLLEQLGELRAILDMNSVADALSAAGIDPVDLASDLDVALTEGWATAGALGAAHDTTSLLVHQRKAWREAFIGWVGVVRTMLKSAPASAREAVAEVRRRLGRYPGKSFSRARDQLDLTVTALRLHADVLQIHTWSNDPFGPADELVAQAIQLVEASNEADRERALQSERGAEARARAQNLIRLVRTAWQMAQANRPSLPTLHLDALTRYQPQPRRQRQIPQDAEKSESEAFSGRSEAFSGELEAFSRESVPFSGELEACSRESEAFSRELEAFSREFEACS